MKRQLLILLTTGMLSIASWAQVLTANQTTYHTLVGVKRPIWWRLCTTGSADNCTQPADKTVNLSVTAGSCTLSTASTTADFAEFTAPATAGTCTISAQAAAGGSAATINVTAYTGRQGHRIAPFYTVLYKGQTTVLQSILYGYADTSVASWSVSPSTGLTISGSGRSVAVTGVTAGTYTVTATSTQGSVAATATIVVTNNDLPASPLPSKTFPTDCTAVGSGTTYNLTNQAEAEALAWNSLQAGDTVRIHYNATPYAFSVQMTQSGTATQPVRVCGVRDPSTGNLPKINAAGAVYVGTQPSGWQSAVKGVFVYHKGCCGYSRAEQDNAGATSYNLIEGLEIYGAEPPNTVGSYTWGGGSAAIYMRGAYDIVVRGNHLHDNGQGVMASPVSGSGEANFNRRIVIEGNHIAANAVHASGSMHNQYLQGESFVVQGNYLARNRAGSAGSTLKIRSTGAWVRYNYIEGTARDVDFVEIQDWMQYVIPKQASFPELGDANDPWTWDDLVTLHELYQHHFMYGNVLNDDNSTGATPTFSIHYFHDIFPDTNHSATTDTELGGTLYLYHNSWRMNGATARSQYAIDGSRAPAAAIPNQWPSVYLVNNAISLEGSVNFKWATATSDRLTLDKNWISTGWDAGANHLGNVTGFFNYQCGETSDTKCYPSAFATGNHHVADFGRLVTGTSPFTSTTTYAPAAALVGSAQALPSAISDLPPLVSYSPATQAWTVRSSAADMGAIDGGTAPDPPASNGVTFSGVTLSGVTVQ